jgi:hypothetical protein
MVSETIRVRAAGSATLTLSVDHREAARACRRGRIRHERDRRQPGEEERLVFTGPL